MASLADLSNDQLGLLSSINEYVGQRVAMRQRPSPSKSSQRGVSFGHAATLVGAMEHQDGLRHEFIARARGLTEQETKAVADVLTMYYPPEKPVHHEAVQSAIAEATRISSTWDCIRKVWAEAATRPVSEPDINDPRLTWC